MSLASANKVDVLRDRAEMMAQARAFFAERGVLEVDVPLLKQSAPIDTHIDLVEASCLGRRCYLYSSPEYGMKRLLAEGVGDIYQLSHVFRDGERGEWHQPEFTMAEWYREGFTLSQMIEETKEFIRLFFDGECEVVANFPASEAALATVNEQGMANRFELVYNGLELANGYHELTDPDEHVRRFERANREREALGKKALPMDEEFIAALRQGMPPCSGVAVGFDRLMMVRHRARSIEEVIPFAFSLGL